MIQNYKINQNRTRKKRGQVQMIETITVLFIFFILVAVGIMFYAKYQKSALEDKRQELQVTRASTVALRAAFLPELQCTKGDAEPEEYCIDLIKARSFNPRLRSSFEDYYYDLFSFATITLTQVYPDELPPLEIYAKPKEGAKPIATQFVVAIRDQTKGGVNPSYGYGYLEVKVYS